MVTDNHLQIGGEIGDHLSVEAVHTIGAPNLAPFVNEQEQQHVGHAAI